LPVSAALFDRFLSTPEMVDAFGAPALVGHMLAFEAALARAQADEGMMTTADASTIASACRIEPIDIEALVADGIVAGTLAVPLVRRLTAAVACVDPHAAGQVHRGATSQDVIDTAMVLATRGALAVIDADLARLVDALLATARRHIDTPMLARTLLQPALVTSVGFKLAGWIGPLVRSRQRLRTAAAAALKLQLGGAVGTLASMDGHGPAVAQRMATALGLPVTTPFSCWQTQRDEWVALGCEVGVLCGSLGKIAKDIALCAQAEIGEMAEPVATAAGASRGGSSAMPHKRNPVAAMTAIAASMRAPQRVAALLATMTQEHERGLGNWQAELAEWPGLFLSAHGSVRALADAAPGLAIDAARMRANIDALQGLVFAEAAAAVLAQHVGKAGAHALLEACSQQVIAGRRHLREVVGERVAADAALSKSIAPAALEAAFDADAVAARAGSLAAGRLDGLLPVHMALG
jgi:3-carboxy-cis,cis-muconate cycloisomerase